MCCGGGGGCGVDTYGDAVFVCALDDDRLSDMMMYRCDDWCGEASVEVECIC